MPLKSKGAGLRVVSMEKIKELKQSRAPNSVSGAKRKQRGPEEQ